MKAIYEAGLRVPKNIVLIGAGVVAFAGEYRNALTEFFAITDKLYERAKEEGEACWIEIVDVASPPEPCP